MWIVSKQHLDHCPKGYTSSRTVPDMPGPVFLRGDTVDLHTVEREDIDFHHRNHNRPEVRHWMPAVHPKTRDEIEEQFEDRDEDDTALQGCVDGEPVGTVYVFD